MIRKLSQHSPRFQRISAILNEDALPPRYLHFIRQAIYASPNIHTYSQIHLLPARIRRRLADAFGSDHILTLEAPSVDTSQQCIKPLLTLRKDQEQVEAVWMQFRDSQHTSVCLSSQVGCALKCAFCATGAAGFKRQLDADEITDQILFFLKQQQSLDSRDPLKMAKLPDTISFMGMGEALNNPRTFDALHILTEGMGLSPRRISVSTVGVVPGIAKLSRTFPQINLAFSLHSPFKDQRNELVPMNKMYPLDVVMPVLEEHVLRTKRKVFLAYLVLPEYNDSKDHAMAIVDLLDKLDPRTRPLFHLNLLKYNPAQGVPKEFKQTTKDEVMRFRGYFPQGRVPITVRQSFGVDIDAACGQLYRIAQKQKAKATA